MKPAHSSGESGIPKGESAHVERRGNTASATDTTTMDPPPTTTTKATLLSSSAELNPGAVDINLNQSGQMGQVRPSSTSSAAHHDTSPLIVAVDDSNGPPAVGAAHSSGSPVPNDTAVDSTAPRSAAVEDSSGNRACLRHDRALFCLTLEHPLRQWLLAVINSKAFFIATMSTILLNCVILAFDMPAFSWPNWFVQVPFYSDYVFTSLFLLEMIFKVCALGLILHPGAYLRTPWNAFDGIVTVSTTVSLFLSTGNLSALRAFRVMRPLRTISQMKRLRALMEAFISTGPQMLVISFLSVVFILGCSTLNVQYCGDGNMNQRCYVTQSLANTSAVSIVAGSNVTISPAPTTRAPTVPNSTTATARPTTATTTTSTTTARTATSMTASMTTTSRPTTTRTLTTTTTTTTIPTVTTNFTATRPLNTTTPLPTWALILGEVSNTSQTDVVLWDGVMGCGGSVACPTGSYCAVKRDLVDVSPMTYDNLWNAMLVTLKVLFVDAWPVVLESATDTCGTGTLALTIPVSFVGGFVITNLFLAVLLTQYARTANEGTSKQNLRRLSMSERKAMKKKPHHHHHHRHRRRSVIHGGSEEDAAGQSILMGDVSIVTTPPTDATKKEHGGAVAEPRRSPRAPPALSGAFGGIPTVQATFSNSSDEGEGKNVAGDDKTKPLKTKATRNSSKSNASSGGLQLLPQMSFTFDPASNQPGAVRSPVSGGHAARHDISATGLPADKGTLLSPQNRARRGSGVSFTLPPPITIGPSAADVTSTSSDSKKTPKAGAAGGRRPTLATSMLLGNPSLLVRSGVLNSGKNAANRSMRFDKKSMEMEKSLRAIRNMNATAVVVDDDEDDDDDDDVPSYQRHRRAALTNAKVHDGYDDTDASPNDDYDDSSSDEGDGHSKKKAASLSSGSSSDTSDEIDRSDIKPKWRRNTSTPQRRMSASSVEMQQVGSASKYRQRDGASAAGEHNHSNNAGDMAVLSADTSVVAATDEPQHGVDSARSGEPMFQPEDDPAGMRHSRNRPPRHGGKESPVPEDDDAQVGPCRRKFQAFVDALEWPMLFVTLVNTVVFVVDYYGASASYEYVLTIISASCAAMFALELILRVLAYGPVKTFRDKWNVFNLVLVVLSVAEFVYLDSTSVSSLRTFRILRLFRAFRALRIAQSVRSLYVLLMGLQPALLPAFSALGIIVVVVFIFSLIGMQFFGADILHAANSVPGKGPALLGPTDRPIRRVSFATIWDSMLWSFVILTGEDWHNIMLHLVDMGSSPYAAYPFCIVLFILGNYVLVNLFGAVLIESFESAAARAREENYEVDLGDLAQQKKFPPRLILPQVPITAQIAKNYIVERDAAVESRDAANAKPPPLATDAVVSFTLPSHSDSTSGGRPLLNRRLKHASRFPTVYVMPQEIELFESTTDQPLAFIGGSTTLNAETVVSTPILQGTSLFLFSPGNRLRTFLAAIVLSPAWAALCVAVVFVNILYLSTESQLRSAPPNMLDSSRYFANYVFVGFYALDALLKIIVQGFIFPRREAHCFPDGSDFGGLVERRDAMVSAYTTYGSNVFNLVIVVHGIVGLFFPQVRIVDAIRSLKIIQETPHLRLIVFSVVKSFPGILQALFLCFVLWTIFAAIGMQLFMGQMYYCNDATVTLQSDCVGYYLSPLDRSVGDLQLRVSEYANMTRKWTPWETNFDDFPEACFSLFVVAMGERWTTVMYRTIDSTEPGRGPALDTAPWYAIFFVVFVFVGNFFTLNMVMGALVTFFLEEKRKQDDSMLLTQDQRLYVFTRRILDMTMFSYDPAPPRSVIRRAFFNLLTVSLADLCRDNEKDESAATIAKRKQKKNQRDLLSKFVIVTDLPLWELVVCVVTLSAAASLCAKGFTLNAIASRAFYWLWIAMIITIVIECIAKMVAFSIGYMLIPRHQMDFVLMALLLISWVFPWLVWIQPVAVVLRSWRFILLLSQSHSAQWLVALTIQAFRSFATVLILLSMMLVVFSYVGMHLYANAAIAPPLSTTINFQSMPASMLTFYIILTTESWLDIAKQCAQPSPDCAACDSRVAYPFFTTYLALACLIVMQLTAVVIVEHMDDVDNCGEQEVISAFQKMRDLWRELARSTNSSISVDRLVLLLSRLPRRISKLRVGATWRDIFLLLSRLRIQVSQDLKIRYEPVVQALLLHTFDIDASRVRPHLVQLTANIANPHTFTVAHVLAVRLIWAHWRQHLEMRRSVMHVRRRSIGDDDSIDDEGVPPFDPLTYDEDDD